MSTALKQEVKELAGKLLERRTKLAGWLAEKENGQVKADATRLGEIKAVDDELNDLQPQYDTKKSMLDRAIANDAALAGLKSVQLPGGFHASGAGNDGVYTNEQGEVKSFGDSFVEGDGYKTYLGSRKQGRVAKPQFEDELTGSLKTVFARTAGWSPFANRQPGYVSFAQQQPKLLDLIPMFNTSEWAIRFMQHTLNTNAAATFAETGSLPESAYGLTEVTMPIQNIGHYIPVTEQQLADVPGVRDFLNTQLELGCRQVVDKQIGSLAGDGTGSNLLSFFSAPGVQYMPQGNVDPIHDSIYKAMVLVQTNGFVDPDAVWMTPLNWQSVRLQKTSQGVYLWGNPDQVGPQRMWGLPVATSTYLPGDTALIGAFQSCSALWMRQGVAVEVSNSHLDYFIKNQLAIRAVMRLCLTIFKALGFAKVGIGKTS